MSFSRCHHFITARGSDCSYPRAVLSHEQALTIVVRFRFVFVNKSHTGICLKVLEACSTSKRKYARVSVIVSNYTKILFCACSFYVSETFYVK